MTGHIPRGSDDTTRISRVRLLDMERRRVRGELVRRFWLRWHMGVIVTATVATGIVANTALLSIPIHAMAWRWLLVVAISYFAFFGCVRVWLAYVGARPFYNDDRWNELGQIDPGSGTGTGHWHGGGGEFGGAGASGGFDTGAADALDVPLDSAGSTLSDSWPSGAEDALSAADNEGCAIVILGIVLAAVLSALAGSAIYLVVMAPEMLGDAAFSAMLAGGLLRSVRRMDEFGWKGSVIKSTWKPAVGIAAFAWLAGLVATHFVPGARTLAEVLMLYH